MVSSAYDNTFRDVQFLMSCMYMRNIIGPRILHWRTPHVASKAVVYYCIVFTLGEVTFKPLISNSSNTIKVKFI